MHRTLTAAACAAAIASVANGAEPHSLTYSEFEESVPHFDLEDCPTSIATPKTFCRVSFNGDAVHVFVFSEDGEQPLVGFRSFDEDGYSLELK
ncbi:MAG: hypothetical protein AAFP68_20590, partial [Pseudomonadota bacterium]